VETARDFGYSQIAMVALKEQVESLLGARYKNNARIFTLTQSALTELFGHPPALYMPPEDAYRTKKGDVLHARLSGLIEKLSKLVAKSESRVENKAGRWYARYRGRLAFYIPLALLAMVCLRIVSQFSGPRHSFHFQRQRRRDRKHLGLESAP
jgi:hypothetical protein